MRALDKKSTSLQDFLKSAREEGIFDSKELNVYLIEITGCVPRYKYIKSKIKKLVSISDIFYPLLDDLIDSNLNDISRYSISRYFITSRMLEKKTINSLRNNKYLAEGLIGIDYFFSSHIVDKNDIVIKGFNLEDYIYDLFSSNLNGSSKIGKRVTVRYNGFQSDIDIIIFSKDRIEDLLSLILRVSIGSIMFGDKTHKNNAPNGIRTHVSSSRSSND